MSNKEESVQSKIQSEDYILSKHDEIISLIFKPGVLKVFPVPKFEHLRDLTYLGLAGNNLTELGKEVLYTFPNLSWLDLRNNKLQSFPSYDNHENLETILLGCNQIKRLPIELGSFKKLSCLQISENPLEFPSDVDLSSAGSDIITFLKLCWQQKTEKPNFNSKSEKKINQTKVKKIDCNKPVKEYRNVSNVIIDKINSLDPINQEIAERVTKRLRHIEKQLQKTRDREALKAWRERYMGKGVARRKRQEDLPFGTDEEYLRMMSRDELLSFRSDPREKKQFRRFMKPTRNIDNDLRNIQQLLVDIKSRKSNEDFFKDISQKLSELKEINEIQKRIKALRMAF